MSKFSTQFKASAREQLEATFNEMVTYARTGETTITGMSVRFSEQEVESIDVDGVYGRDMFSIFVVEAAGIDFGAGAVDPERSDIITRTDGRKYTVRHKGTYITNTAEWRVPVVETET